MRAVDVIIHKRDQKELTDEEIAFFVRGFTNGEIPDYQVSAWAMAVLLNGMTEQETTALTMAMAHSGDVLDLSIAAPHTVDKHSTGGVGDKTTLTLLPLAAACGLKVGKMSGRGLGFSGGTLDKLESIPGYCVDLTRQEFLEQLKNFGLVLSGQSADLAPADGKLYALRDVTGTVPSLPLIASSIMSKKLAAGARALVLDVKVGGGAFMQTLADARALAELMVKIGEASGRKVVCLVTDMNQPLGSAVGNALELKEAVQTLQGNGPSDYLEHCLLLGSYMLVLGGLAETISAARMRLEAAIRDGSAFEKFCALVEYQRGDVSFVRDLEKLPRARRVETVLAPRTGWLVAVRARDVGETAVELGAGRIKKGMPVDHAVGIEILHKVGDQVQKGEPLFVLHANSDQQCEAARLRLLKAHEISDEPQKSLPHIYAILPDAYALRS